MTLEADGVQQAEFRHEAAERPVVGVGGRLADDAQGGGGVTVEPGHGEGRDGVLERLVG